MHWTSSHSPASDPNELLPFKCHSFRGITKQTTPNKGYYNSVRTQSVVLSVWDYFPHRLPHHPPIESRRSGPRGRSLIPYRGIVPGMSLTSLGSGARCLLNGFELPGVATRRVPSIPWRPAMCPHRHFLLVRGTRSTRTP